MKRPSIKMALVALLSVIALAVGGLSFTSLTSIRTLSANAEDIGGYWLHRLMTVREIKGNFSNLRLAYARYAMAKTPEDFQDEARNLTAARAALQAAIETYTQGARTARGKELIATIYPAVASYEKLGADYTNLLVAGKFAEGTALYKQGMKPDADRVNARVDELVAYVVSNADAAVTSSDEAASRAFLVTLTIAALACLVAVCGIVFAIVGIANPIRLITIAMNRLAGGDIKTPIPFNGRADEIGDMATAVEVFRQAAEDNRRLGGEAEAARLRQQAQEADQRRKADEDAEKLRFATETLGQGLKRLADGDISFQLTTPFAPEYESLRTDFNSSLQQLGTAIGAVLHTVDSMDSGTKEIASGANDLSRRTEQQAAALEETAAALDEITVNVSNASKRTEEARSVAVLANQNAAKSAEVVAQAEEAMRRIEGSSQQISNIIGVIDEIAFQTNLLALNAGVEAARAGEAGKGFAVVAQEVRELAQRSAQAAKEIKGLIQNSSTEVEGGVKLVRETGLTLKSIGDYVAQINTLMEAIALSAREQSTGLSEVNVAINQMDQTTQQNAAMVEQSTAASASLAGEADRLKSLVSQFRLSETTAVRGLVASPAAAGPAPVAANAAPPRRMATARVSGNVALKDGWSEF